MSTRDGVFYVPQGFKIDYHGGWCQPNGVFLPLRFNQDPEQVLRSRLNLNNYQEQFTNLTDLAYWLGWSFMSYSHTYGGQRINETKNAKRTFRFTFAPHYISNLRWRSIIAMATVCSDNFKNLGKTAFEIEAMYFSRPPPADGRGTLNIPSRIVSANPMDPVEGTPLLPIESTSNILKYHRLSFLKIGMLSIMSNANATKSPI